jgi:hypothetical protein
MNYYYEARSVRKENLCSISAREAELLALFPVRAIMRRVRVSPILALAIAELAGIVREVRNV